MKSDVQGMIHDFGNSWRTAKLSSTEARLVATILVPQDCSSRFVCMMRDPMYEERCSRHDFGNNWRTAKLGSTDARPVATILVPHDCSSGFVWMMRHQMYEKRCSRHDS
eukprot:10660786-Karenia_brevis.AAC.1